MKTECGCNNWRPGTMWENGECHLCQSLNHQSELGQMAATHDVFITSDIQPGDAVRLWDDSTYALDGGVIQHKITARQHSGGQFRIGRVYHVVLPGCFESRPMATVESIGT